MLLAMKQRVIFLLFWFMNGFHEASPMWVYHMQVGSAYCSDVHSLQNLSHYHPQSSQIEEGMPNPHKSTTICLQSLQK